MQTLKNKYERYEQLIEDHDKKETISKFKPSYFGYQNIQIDMQTKKGLQWKNVAEGKASLDEWAVIPTQNRRKSQLPTIPKSAVLEQKAGIELEEEGVPVNCIKFNQCPGRQSYFISVDDGATLKVWDVKGNLIAQEPRFSNGSIQTCAIEPNDGGLAACGGLDGKVHVFSIRQKFKKEDATIKMIQKQCELIGHRSGITCSGFMNKEYMITGSDDSELMLWNVENTGRPLVVYSDHTFEVSSLDVFDRDRNIFASGASDAQLRIWDVRMKQPCLRVIEKNSSGIGAVKFMPNNVNTLAVGLDDSSIKLVDLRTLGKIAKYNEKSCADGISELEFSKSGRLLFSCSQSSTKIDCWDTIGETKAGIIGQDFLQDGVKSISMSLNGQTLVSAGKKGVIALWQQ